MPERHLYWRFGMHDHHYARDVRGGLFQYLQPLAANWAVGTSEAGNIAARTSEARNEAIADWITNSHKYDWNIRSRALKQSNCRIAECQDHIGRKCDDFGNDGLHLIQSTDPPARFDAGITAIGPSELFKAPKK